MDKTKLKKEQVFIRVKDNPELLRKVEQLLKDTGETVYRNTTEGILETGWEFLAMDYDGDWLGTSDRFVESRGLTEVNLKELTLILGGIWDESLDPVTGERRVWDEPDEGWPIPPDHLIYRTAKFKVGVLVEIKNPKRGHLINPIWIITEAKLNQDTKEWYYEAHITGMTHLRRTFKESEIKLYGEEVSTEIDGNEAEGVTEDLSFQTIADAAVRLLEYKNKHYGNSALNPIEVFNGKTKVGQRADDKLSRIKNHPTLRKADVIDLLGYLILMCKENGWSDFSEFED